MNRWTRALSPVSVEISSSLVCEYFKCCQTEPSVGICGCVHILFYPVAWNFTVCYILQYCACISSQSCFVMNVCLCIQILLTVLFVCTLKVIVTLLVFTLHYYSHSQTIKSLTSFKPDLNINYSVLCNMRKIK